MRLLDGVRRNNTREWYVARKERFEHELHAPLRALVETLSARFARRRIPLYGDVRRSIFRFYRDVRFAHDKRPYNEHLSAYLSRDGGRHTPGGLFLRVGARESFMVMTFYALEPRLLRSWRQAIVAQPEAFARLRAHLAKHDLEIDPPERRREASLGRVPRGFEGYRDSELAPFLRLKSFSVFRELAPAQVQTKELVETCVAFTLTCKPFLVYGWEREREAPLAGMESRENEAGAGNGERDGQDT